MDIWHFKPSDAMDFSKWRGYWHQRAEERFGDPPPKVQPGAFNGQRQAWNGRPPRGPLVLHCFCVGCGSAQLGDLLGVSRSAEHELPSVLFYRRFFSSVFYTVSFFFFIMDVSFCCML